MKYRIESDGTQNGTHVYQDGVEIRGIQKVSFELSVGGPPTLKFDVMTRYPEVAITSSTGRMKDEVSP